MLSTIINRLSTAISTRLQQNYGLAKILYQGKKSFPAKYVGQGQYKPIEIDNWAGMNYFRLNGDIASSNEEVRASCGKAIKLIYPIRLIACVKKSVLGKDDAFSSETLSLLLIKDIKSITELPSDLSAMRASIEVSRFSTDDKEILSREYSGIELLKNGINYEYCLVAIDMDIEILINADCIELTCKEYCNG